MKNRHGINVLLQNHLSVAALMLLWQFEMLIFLMIAAHSPRRRGQSWLDVLQIAFFFFFFG